MAGPWYVRSTNASSGDGTTWAEGVKTLAEAFALASAGDYIYVSQAHSETAAVTLTSPGTAAAPCKIICINDSTSALCAPRTATIAATGNSNLSFDGFAFYYGIIFYANVNANYAVKIGLTSEFGLIFKGCKFQAKTNTGINIIFGSTGDTAPDGRYILWDDVDYDSGNVANAILQCGAKFIWKDGAVVTTAPTNLFNTGSGYIRNFDCKVIGCDLSVMGSSKYLVNGTQSGAGEILFSNCKLGASVSVLNGSSMSTWGAATVMLDACDSGDPSSGPRSEVYTYHGSVISSTSVYRSGGASDGTSYSLKMTAIADVSFFNPLVTRPIFKVAETTGSEITVTAEIIQADGSTALDESECWMEVEYMGTSGYPISSFVTDHNSTIIALSTTDQTTSTETWTGLAGTPVKQKLSCAFTPAEKGYYMVRIFLARPSAVVYVCPKLTVS